MALENFEGPLLGRTPTIISVFWSPLPSPSSVTALRKCLVSWFIFVFPLHEGLTWEKPNCPAGKMRALHWLFSLPLPIGHFGLLAHETSLPSRMAGWGWEGGRGEMEGTSIHQLLFKVCEPLGWGLPQMPGWGHCTQRQQHLHLKPYLLQAVPLMILEENPPV